MKDFDSTPNLNPEEQVTANEVGRLAHEAYANWEQATTQEERERWEAETGFEIQRLRGHSAVHRAFMGLARTWSGTDEYREYEHGASSHHDALSRYADSLFYDAVWDMLRKPLKLDRDMVAYLTTIARNTIIDRCRKAKRKWNEDLPLDKVDLVFDKNIQNLEDQAFSDLYLQENWAEIAEFCHPHLTSLQRCILDLLFQDYTREEICEKLGRTKEAFRVHLHAIRKVIKRRYDRDWWFGHIDDDEDDPEEADDGTAR